MGKSWNQLVIHTVTYLLFLLNIKLIIFFKKPDWEDIDQEHMHDPNQAGLYVNDIFNHYKKREVSYPSFSYLIFESLCLCTCFWFAELICTCFWFSEFMGGNR